MNSKILIVMGALASVSLITIYTFHTHISGYLIEKPTDSLATLEHYTKDSDEIALMRYANKQIKTGHLSGHYTDYYGKTVVWKSDDNLGKHSYVGVMPNYMFNRK